MRTSKLILELKALNNKIERCIKEEYYEEIEVLFTEYEKTVKTEAFYTLKSTYLFQIGSYRKGIDILEEAIHLFPFSYNINYNLSMLYNVNGDLKHSLYQFSKCFQLGTNEKEQQLVMDNIQKVIKILQSKMKNKLSEFNLMVEDIKRTLQETDERFYPMNRFGKSVIRKVIKEKNRDSYLVNNYRSFQVTDVDHSNRFYLKSELLKGLNTKKQTIILESPSTIPISFIEKNTDFKVITKEKTYFFEKDKFPINQYNYLTFKEVGTLTFESEEEMFIGKPIALNVEKKSPKLILYIFIDGLAYDYLEKHGANELMPNTYKYFQDGYINTNCFTTGDWTYPSVAAMHTGKYTMNHGMFHPTHHKEFREDTILFPEYLQKKGYFTAQINGNWRVTPRLGYQRAYDRILYQNSLGGFGAGEVISETIEHLETFKGQNNFLWLSLQDLHDVADSIQNVLMSQVEVQAEYRQSKTTNTTSALTKYDENKHERYSKEIQRLDRHLSSLYSYLDNYYEKEDILVVLNSDHGQAFLEQDSSSLHESKRRVPLMMSGKGVPQLSSNKFTEVVDVFPTLFEIINNPINLDAIDGRVMYDFGGEERKFATTESFHPDQTYKVSITDAIHIFRFETEQLVTKNGSVDFEKYSVKLINKKSLVDEADLYFQKVEDYVDYIFRNRVQFHH